MFSQMRLGTLCASWTFASCEACGCPAACCTQLRSSRAYADVGARLAGAADGVDGDAHVLLRLVDETVRFYFILE